MNQYRASTSIALQMQGATNFPIAGRVCPRAKRFQEASDGRGGADAGLIAQSPYFVAARAEFVANHERWNRSCEESGVRLTVFLVLLSFFRVDLPAQSALRSAKAAQALLGPATWSRVIRVENKNPKSVYPRDEYALVFEFAGILWFYSESDGTQSFSLFENRLAREKMDFGPGLRAIEPGFGAYSVMSDRPESASKRASLANGCFIESVVAARERYSRGEHITAAKLVLFYAAHRREGHCVLAYETPDGIFTLDPGGSSKPRFFGRRWPDDSFDLARAAWPGGSRSALSQVRTLNCPITPQIGADAAAWVSADHGSRPADAKTLAEPGRG